MGTATADRAISAPRLFDGEEWHNDSALLLARPTLRSAAGGHPSARVC